MTYLFPPSITLNILRRSGAVGPGRCQSSIKQFPGHHPGDRYCPNLMTRVTRAECVTANWNFPACHARSLGPVAGALEFEQIGIKFPGFSPSVSVMFWVRSARRRPQSLQ